MSPQSPSRLYPRRCEICGKGVGLTLCPGCRIVWYCGKDHQASDVESHRKRCREVQDSNSEYKVKERQFEGAIRTAEPGNWARLRRDEFEREYLYSRNDHAGAILTTFGYTIEGPGASRRVTGRAEAVEAALDHLRAMLWDERCHYYEVLQSSIAGLYVALLRDQEAYDSTKRVTLGSAAKTGFTHPAPLASGADVLEPPLDLWLHPTHQHASFPGAVGSSTVLLIKVRALLDLREMQNAARALAGALPREILDLIRGHLLRGALSSRPDVLRLDVEATAGIMADLKGQVWALWRAISAQESVLWDIIFGEEGRPVAVGGGELPAEAVDGIRALVERLALGWLLDPEALDALRVLRSSNPNFWA